MAFTRMKFPVNDLLTFDYRTFGEAVHPGIPPPFAYHGCQCRKHLGGIRIDADLDRDNLPYLRCIYVNVNDFGLLRIFAQGTGHPVVEAHSHSNEDIAFIGLDIRGDIAVHAYHALVKS